MGSHVSKTLDDISNNNTIKWRKFVIHSKLKAIEELTEQLLQV